MAGADAEVETLRQAVARHFTVYGTVVTPLALTFQVTPPPDGVGEPFDALRLDLVPRDYIPSITQERGETLVHVQRRPKPRFARREVNLALLVLTVITTVFFGGAYNWSGYSGSPFFSAESVGMGALFFGVPLLTILGAHEMGHYLVARRYHVHASLPFFLPSVPPLGTFGAFISMRDPIPNRKALLDIGISGPLVGFAIAIPVTLAGLGLSSSGAAPPVIPTGDYEIIRGSILFDVLSLFFPLPEVYSLHPLAFAGWVGLFVTAINLLPAGQLDGGHVARALLGDRQHLLSWAAVLALFVMGTFYPGWFIFGMLILLLGVRHPPPLNDLTRLDPGRKLLGLAAVLILVLTFIPQPFALVQASRGIAFESLSGDGLDRLVDNVSLGGAVLLSFVVNNTGGSREAVALRIDPRNLDNFGWDLRFVDLDIRSGNASRVVPVDAAEANFTLNGSERAIVRLEVRAPATLDPVPPRVQFLVVGEALGVGRTEELVVLLNVV
ncbi:MAG: hypothetical protein A3K68_02950 [Euryarchaeota archaeon RBG_16_68_13]|nr:MAG: hypothetical protein A3K68_02950 [Euryarchaeota archaeon RBG_16_68_13]